MSGRNVHLGSDGKPSLTEGEQRFIKAIFECIAGLPDTDWDKAAEMLNLKDAKCARERWRQIAIKREWCQYTKRTSGASGAGSGASTSVAVSASGSAVRSSSLGARGAGVATRPSYAGVLASGPSAACSLMRVRPDSASAALLRHVASGRVTKNTSVKNEAVAKKEDDVKRESRLKSESTINNETSSYFKKESNIKSERNVKTETIDLTACGTKHKEHGSDSDVIEVEEGHWQAKNAESKKDDHDPDDDNMGSGYIGSQIVFGHPNHCMSF